MSAQWLYARNSNINKKTDPDSTTGPKMFESISVWRRASDGTLRHYRCFKSLTTGGYSVQSCDFYPTSFDSEKAAFFGEHSLHLLAESSPEERAGSFVTLLEAIEAHDRDFENER